MVDQKVSNLRKKIVVILILFQTILIFVGGLYTIASFFTPYGNLPVFNNEDVIVNPKLQCLEFKDYQGHYEFTKNIHIIRCSENDSRIVWKDSLDYSFNIFSEKLYYDKEADSFIAIINNKIFYANKSNNYIMEIPIQYEDFDETSIVKIKMHVEYIEPPNYWLWGLIIFSPTILLITILIIRRLKRK